MINSQMKELVAVAVTMLYDSHKADVLRVFQIDELGEIVKLTDALGNQQVEDIYKRAWVALAATQQEVQAEGIHHGAKDTNCPITGRKYFMHIEHPVLGLVPTYGGPYDSYTVPTLHGKPTQPLHEREMSCERYDHDLGRWINGEPVPLRLIYEDELFSLEERADKSPQPAHGLAKGVCNGMR